MHFKNKNSKHYDFTKEWGICNQVGLRPMPIFLQRSVRSRLVDWGAQQKGSSTWVLKATGLRLDSLGLPETFGEMFQSAGCPEPDARLTEIIELVLLLLLRSHLPHLQSWMVRTGKI